MIPKGEAVELLPRPPRIMSLQLNLIRKYELEAERIGSGQNARIRILPFSCSNEEELNDPGNVNGNSNGSAFAVEKLPLLPD